MIQRIRQSRTRRRRYKKASKAIESLNLLLFMLKLLPEPEVKSLSDYGRRVRGLTAGLWRGVIDEASFVSGIEAAIRRGMEQAWREGSTECGVEIAERTDDEKEALKIRIEEAGSTAENFASWIVDHNRASGGKLKTIHSRALMWTNQYNQTRSLAQQMTCANRKLMWVWNPEKEHCDDCRVLNGRVHRASQWQRWGIAPQSRRLECGGWRCGCKFVVTTEPATRGRPPKFSRVEE